MPQRTLEFRNLAHVAAELDRLGRGYDRHGAWDLAQVCNHLAHRRLARRTPVHHAVDLESPVWPVGAAAHLEDSAHEDGRVYAAKAVARAWGRSGGGRRAAAAGARTS
ncbi:MAG: DUF1569 domain-containing protein [Gemmataceae bacterium]|nr:DUF1569 domain-containing protein [Gemmataceae bacterium]